LCSPDLTVELVGGAETAGFEANRNYFAYAHKSLPGLNPGVQPRWVAALFGNEALALGFRTIDGIEGLNEVHRLEAAGERIQRIRCYCFCPELLGEVARDLGLKALLRPYRSPSAGEFLLALVGIGRHGRKPPRG